jgi:proline iminopeptidase
MTVGQGRQQLVGGEGAAVPWVVVVRGFVAGPGVVPDLVSDVVLVGGGRLAMDVDAVGRRSGGGEQPGGQTQHGDPASGQGHGADCHSATGRCQVRRATPGGLRIGSEGPPPTFPEMTTMEGMHMQRTTRHHARPAPGLVLLLLAGLAALAGCEGPGAPVADVTTTTAAATVPAAYLDSSGRDDALAGGVRMIPVETPSGTYRVWTKRFGNNPRVKLLLLHGGPGATHEAFEALDSYLPAAGVEYYYYDQLGSFYSDQPDDPSLWRTERFVDEVEQVRRALGLDADDFYLLGHSWGGILAIEYALAHQEHLKGLVISNMMASIPAYNDYARNVLEPQIDPDVLAEVKGYEAAEDYDNPRYMGLLMQHHYTKHLLRMPLAAWPDPVNRTFEHLNPKVYVPMQGPSELGASGLLADWDRTADLHEITVPTLVIGARYDTMDPAHMEWMAGELPRGRYLFCPEGSHLALYDDQQTYVEGLVRFLHDVDAGRL